MIRLLESFEKLNIRPIYEHCFSEDGKEFTDYYFSKCLPHNEVVVNEQDGKIVSALHLIPKNLVVGSLKTNVMYIYAVGTFAGYRNKGYMHEIFNEVLKKMYENMDAFTYLIPSDENNAAIYERFGFNYVMDKFEITPTEHRRKATHSLILRKADNSDLVKLSIFAQSTAYNKYSVVVSKDVEYFKRIKELIDVEGGHIDIYVENKVIVGYRIWIDHEIFEEVLDSSIQSLSWESDVRKPYVMARIINIRKTLRMFEFKNIDEIVFKITDPILDENNGYFVMTQKHGSIKLEKKSEKDIEGEPDFDIGIGELTAHIFGYKLIPGLPAVCRKDSFFINDYV